MSYDKDMFKQKRLMKEKGLAGSKRYNKIMYRQDIITELDKIEEAYKESIQKGTKVLAKFRRAFIANPNDEIKLIDKDDGIQN